MISRSAVACGALTFLGAVVCAGGIDGCSQRPRGNTDSAGPPGAAAAAATVIEACYGPGYGPAPAPQPAADAVPFAVRFNCLWPSRQRMEIAVSLESAGKRPDVEKLLHVLWEQLEAGMGKAFPEIVNLCVLPAGVTAWTDKPLGCISKGYEPEGPEAGEEEEEMRIDMPEEPATWAASLTKSYAKRFLGSRKPRVTFDEARGELKVVYSYVDGADQWAPRLSLADAALPLFALAWDFYPPKTALRSLVFEGVWKGKPVVRVSIPDLQTFLAMDPWPIRERLDEAQIPFDPGARRTPAQDAVVGAELAQALGKLPRAGVVLDPALANLAKP
jgi:hypothetical protein